MVQRAISNIRNVLLQKQTEIMSIATMLMVIGLVTKVFGLVYSSVVAGRIGKEVYSNFVFASNIPELISQVILLGAISASVLPLLAKVLAEKGEYRFVRVFNTLVNGSVILFTLLALFIGLTAEFTIPWLITYIIQPETPIPAAQLPEIVAMLRVLMIPQVILGVSVYLTTALNLYDRFLVPQLAPLLYNVGRIIGLFIFLPILGQSPWVLVWGTLIGSILHLAIQIPVVFHLRIKYAPILDVKDYYIHKIARVATPRIAALSVEEIAKTLDKFIAFGLVQGSLALYNLAISVISIPLALIGSSFATASFPTLAKAFAKNDRILATQIFLRIMNQIFFFSVPAGVLLLVLRVPISRMTFGLVGDQIGFLETYTIAWAILFFAPGIIFESLRIFLYRTFYAAHDTLRPLVVSIFTLILGVSTGVLFTNYFSHYSDFSLGQLTLNLSYLFNREAGAPAVGGLALSSSVVFTLEAVILIYWLNRRYLKAKWSEVIGPLAKKLVAGAFMLVVCYFIYKIWAGLESTEKTIYLFFLFATTTAASVMTYFGICGLLRIEEVGVFLRFFSKYPSLKAIRRAISRLRKFDPIASETTV